MDDNIDDEAAVATYMLPRIMREKRNQRRTIWVPPWVMQRFTSISVNIQLFTRLSCDAVIALNTTLIMQYRPTFVARYLHIIVVYLQTWIYIQKMSNVIIYLYQHTTSPFFYQQQVSYQSHCSVSAVSYDKNRTCSIPDNLSYDKKLYTSDKNRTLLSSNNIVRFLSLV